MDEIQPITNSSGLHENFRKLQVQIQIMLLLLILVSATLTLVLWRQYREVRGGVQSTKDAITNYTNAAPAMDEFFRAVVTYARTHPDLAQTLSKYGINANAAPANPPSNQPQVPKK